MIPAFGVALGAAFLGGVLAAPGWAQSTLFGPCVNDDMTPVSDPCFESIKWAGSPNGFVSGVDEVVWRVTIRGSSPIKRKPDFAEGSIDDAVVVTASSGPNPSSTVSDVPVDIANGVGRYRYNIKVPIVRQYEGTVSLTLGAFEDTSGNGITAGQTPRGENQRTFTVSNVHQIADLRTVRIANGLRVRWRAARSAPAGYLVRWKEETGTFNQGEVVMTGTSYDITGLTVGTTYTVSVGTRNTGQGPMGRDTFRNSGLEVTRRVLDQLADIPSTGSVDADSDSTSIGSPVLPENGQNSYKIVSWTATDSGYGNYEVARGHSGGTVYIWRWFYRLNKDNEEVKALAPGDTLTDTFTMEDNSEPPREATVTITITKSPPPTTICIKVGIDILGHDDGCVDEDLEILATEDSSVTQWRGRAVVTDPDAPERSFIPVQTRGTYGKFSLGADGLWVYALNNADPDTNALGIGQAGLDEFMIETVGGAATRKIRVGVWGANDPATFSGNLSGSVTEDIPFSYEACLRRNNPDPRTEGYMCLERGTINLGVITSGKVTVSDPDSNNASALKKRQGVQKGTYGSLFVNADQGYWRYVLDNDSNHVQGLTAGATVTETFTILAADDTPATVTITITGTRDISTIEGALTGSVTEGGVNTRASGTVRVTFNSATNQFRARSNIRGNYGTFNIDARGNWTYDLDGGDLLREGQVVYEPFRVESTLQNRTTAVVVIKVTGSDVVGAITASVGMGAGSRTSGRLTGHRGFEIGAHTRRGDFGCLIIQGNGTWEYLVYDTAPSSDCQASSGTQTATAGDSESFDLLFSRARYGDACSPDDSLDCISVPESVQFIERTLTININAGIAAVFDASTLTGAITEDTATTSGTVRATDADGDDNKFTAAGSSNPISGNYGSLTITEDGAWTYRLFNTLSAVQALGQGATLNDSLIIQAADGTTGTLVITITGADDQATIGGTVNGFVTEDAVKADNSPDNQATGIVTLRDVDGGSSFTAQTDVDGTYGTFSLATSGVWTYSLDNSDTDTNALRAGQMVNDETFAIAASDGASATVTITITGANDAATFGGTVHGSVTEDATETMATGTMTVTDVDGDNTLQARTLTGTYGDFVVNADGTWTYTLVNSRAATNALREGQTTSEGLQVSASDGTSGPTIIITVTGADDQATIEGDLAGSVTEDAVKTDNSPDNQATGTVTLSDVDGGSSLTAQTDTPGKYGTFSLNATSGVWTYSLDNSDPDTNALRSDQTVNDETFDIAASDGASATVTITITGADDPSIIGGTLAGAVTEDATVTTAGGTASITSTDNTVTFTAQTDVDGTYGTFSLATTGVWTYTLDNSDTDTNALADGVEETDSFTIATSDGSTAAVVITVTGADDQATIGGDLAGSVTEDATETMATGTVTLSDVDGGSSFTEQTDVDGTYGTFSLATSGAWTYSLDNSDPDTNALRAGQTVNDETFDIAASDGASATVTITITGADDPSTIGGTLAGAVTEDATVTTAEGMASITDVDSTVTFTAQTDEDGTYGTFSLATTGVWTYTLDNSDTDTNALADGVEETDSFAITTSDGSTASVVITVTGADDQATIEGDLAGSVTEDATETMATGTATLSDVDGGSSFTEQTDADGTYGTFSLATSGAWTYSLDNSDPDTNALRAGQTVNDETFDIAASDGATATVRITITGANDAATFGGTVHGSVTEDATETMATGTITVTDVDGDNTLQARTVTGLYGDFVVNSNGSWTYTLVNSRAATNALSEGQTVSEAIDVRASDGTVRPDLSITVTGADDQATIEGDLAGSVTEDAVKADNSPDNQATGTVTLSDVDGGSSLTAQTDTAGKYGTFSLNATSGVWTYSLDNSDPDTNALRSGQTVDDETFAIAASDEASATVTISITGADDPSIIGGTLAGAVTEDATDTTARGTASITDVDSTATFTAQTNASGRYGTFSLATTGDWTYSLDNSDTDTNALKEGVEMTDSFTIVTSDGSTAAVVITVTGANDAASITGTLAGSVMEDGTLTASGSVTVTDVDGDDALKEQADQTGKYGSLSVDHSAGSWTYTLNNSADAVQELTGGVRVNDPFTILAADDTPATVTITITGAIDPGDVAGASGSVTEDDTLKARARGRVMLDGVSDATFTAQTNVSGTYGTFNLEANGNWTYDLDNSRPATNALAGGAEVRDTLEIATADNSATAALIITVTGNDDRSTIDAANLAGSVMEDGTGTASKTVTVTDVDTDPAPTIEERRGVSGAYGTFGITPAGVWTYTLDNNAAAVQALGAGQTLTEAFKIETVDGAEAVVTITITGAADPREIEGTVTGSVTEDDEEASSAMGRVTVTGSAGAIFAVKATNPPQSQTYGTFTIQPDGNWTYSLDNDKSMTNALTQGAEATESITIEALEGTTAVDEEDVTITITGANDAAVFGAAGLTGAITEDAVPNTTTGTATVTDVDGDNRFSTEVAPNDGTMLTTGTGSYGSLTIAEDGDWTYTLNNADPDTNALTAGQEVTDSFTIKADDGTETAVTITVTGVTDRGEIEGDVSGSVREAAGDEDDQAQDRASGRVRVAGDPAARFTVQTDKATTYGTFSLTAEGVWTYRLNNDKADDLGQGETMTDTIPIGATASDNTPRTATVTITVMGSEVGGDLTGSIREGSRTPVGGKLTTEQDYEIMNVEDIRRGEFGCLRVRSDGSWTYWLYGTDRLCPRPIEALAQSGTVTVLAAEQARMDVFTIEVMRPDGMVIMVSLTITIEEAAAPVTRTVAVTGYLQGRAEVLLGKQPELGRFLKDLRAGITSEGQVSVDVRDGALLGFDGSFVRDGFWGALSVARSEQGSGRTDQIFGTLGYHGQVADAALVGLMLQFDQADGRLDAGLGSIDGQGWLFGPYFATRYQAQPQVSPLTLEGRLLYGPTSNDVRFVDGGTGTFDTQRWLASFRLEGEVLLDYGDRAIRLIPHFDAGWVQDKVEAFTDSAGMQVAGQTVRFSEVALGSDIEVPVRFGQREAMITGGLSLVSAREQSQGQNARVSVSDTHGRLELGLDYRLANGIELEFGGRYDDVEGTDSEGKFSLSFGLSNQF